LDFLCFIHTQQSPRQNMQFLYCIFLTLGIIEALLATRSHFSHRYFLFESQKAFFDSFGIALNTNFNRSSFFLPKGYICREPLFNSPPHRCYVSLSFSCAPWPDSRVRTPSRGSPRPHPVERRPAAEGQGDPEYLPRIARGDP